MSENEIMEIQKGSAVQGYAISIEYILSDIFGCRRYGFGGLVNSDVIRKYPLATISAGLAYLFAISNSAKKQKIETYLEDYSYYLKMSMDELMSFDSSSKNTDICTIEINYNNGKEAIEDYIEKLRNVVEENI